MKTIKHRTEVSSVDGKDLPETLFAVTDLSVPETREDILSLIETEDGLKSVVKLITDSLKLERNGEIRPVILAKAGLGKITRAVRDKVVAYLSEADLAEAMRIVRLVGKAKDLEIDKFYNNSSQEVKAKILSM